MLEISYDEIKGPSGEAKAFPKYTTQLMNIANQNAQGTRPGVVGQMSELFQECPYTSFDGWKTWYLSKHPDAVNRAVERILPMLHNFSGALTKIDEEMVEEWVKDLVLVKTFKGLSLQKIILKMIAERRKAGYRLATPEEESMGIDGFIDEAPISIKPATYKTEKSLQEDIKARVVYYEIKGDRIFVDDSEFISG